MTMIRETTPDAPARRDGKHVRHVFNRSGAELAMRDAVERWGRAKWPEARVVHELVMDRGTVRADIAFVSPMHIAVVEIKSEHDDTSRLLHQCGMFRLAVPELWIAMTHRHAGDAKLIRHLMPSIGTCLSDRDRQIGPAPDHFDLDEVEPAALFVPWPAATLSLLWASELDAEARRSSLVQGRGSRPQSHASLITKMLRLTWDEQIVAVCRQLRAREAFWRADPPIRVPTPILVS